MFALGLLAAGNSQDQFEDFLAHFFDRGACQDSPSVHVHVGFHTVVHRRVRGHLDRRGRLATIHAAAARGEDADVGAARDDARHADRVVTRCIHHHEALGCDRGGVGNHVNHRGAARLRDCAEGLFVDRGQAAFFVAGRRVVVDLGSEDAGVPLPPLDAFHEFLAHGLRHGSTGEDVLSPVNLRRFAEDGGAALLHDHIRGDAECGVRGDAAVTIRAAAVGAKEDVLGGELNPFDVVDLGQEIEHGLDAEVHRFADAPAFLNSENDRFRFRTAELNEAHVFVFDQVRCLYDFTTEADQNVGPDVRVLRKPRENMFELAVVRAIVLVSATLLVNDRQYTIDVGKVLENVHRADPLGDVFARACGTIHRADNRKVIACPVALMGCAIRAAVVAHECAKLGRWWEWSREVGTVRIVAFERRDFDVVHVNVIARFDVLAGEADDLAELGDRVAFLDPVDGELVAHFDRGRDLESATVELDLDTRRNRRPGHGDVVGWSKVNGELGEG